MQFNRITKRAVTEYLLASHPILIHGPQDQPSGHVTLLLPLGPWFNVDGYPSVLTSPPADRPFYDTLPLSVPTLPLSPTYTASPLNPTPTLWEASGGDQIRRLRVGADAQRKIKC